MKTKNIRKPCLKETKKKIRDSQIGELGNNWKGGKKRTAKGYVLILCHNHPYADKKGYVREHRLVMEKHLGRYLKPKEAIHHKNEILDDNRLENLMLFKSNGQHTVFHLKKNGVMK